jgi:hypothetical protein
MQIEEYMAAQGQAVKRVSLDAAQQQGQADDQAAAPKLTAEDLAGWSKVGLVVAKDWTATQPTNEYIC